MWNPGKVLTIGILAVAISAGVFAWQHQYRRGAQVMELWGTDIAYRIRMADQCELLKLAAPVTDATDTLRIDDQDWQVVERRDISQARGWVHARQALIQDVSYQWDAAETQAQWGIAILFRDPEQPEKATTLAIDLDSGAIRDIQTKRRGNVSPILGGLRIFFDEQWEE